LRYILVVNQNHFFYEMCKIFGIVKKGGTIGMHVSFSQDKGMG
jgi:hypothetical protein